MDMRRKAASPIGADRLVLSLYWLTSGYALRSGRALVAFLVVVSAFAWLFDQHGFSDPESFYRALAYSARAATAIFGGLERQLTTWGEAFRIVLRIIGPVLLGLVALSLRARVKR